MSADPKNREGRLVWIDLEMSGLNPERERILEIASIVTEADLTLVAEGPELVVRQPESVLGRMDDWNRTQHTQSGLLERVRHCDIGEREAEERTLSFLREHCDPGRVPLAGNSVHHDRRFLGRYMPRIVAHLHYRIVDVSTVKELARRWHPEVHAACPPKPDTHRALNDIRASIDELRYYRRELFRPPSDRAAP